MKKLILDLDTGIDDAFALSYAIKNKDIDLIGVTTIYGNVEVETSIRNSNNIINLLGKKVPVYKGLSNGFSGIYERRDIVKRIHGNNGIANIDLKESGFKANPLSAYDFLKEQLLLDDSENLVVVFTGPLTNLAELILNEPQVLKTKATIAVMGGALRVRGNASEYAEANILEDYKAAKIVFDSDLKILMFALDVTHKVIFQKDDFKDNQLYDGFFQKLANYYCDNTINPKEGCFIHDAVAVIGTLHQDFIKVEKVKIDITTDGKEKGQMTEINVDKKNVSFCYEVESEKIRKELLSTLKV